MRLKNVPGSAEYIEKSGYVINDPAAHAGSWKDVFGNDAPIRLEIGMGKGQFIIGLAERNPGINYIGMEKYASVILRGVQKQEQAQLPNLQLIRADAADLEEMFAAGEIDRIYLNFSDPWPKDRHYKRRLTSDVFLKRYESVLRPEGIVEMKTDNVPLFDFSLESLESRGWKLLYVSRDFHHEPDYDPAENVMTEYEEKFSREGQAVMKLIARRP